MVDMVVPRTDMRKTLVEILDFFGDIDKPVGEKPRPAILKTPPHIEVKADAKESNRPAGNAQ
jgi:hypothetical protein